MALNALNRGLAAPPATPRRTIAILAPRASCFAKVAGVPLTQRAVLSALRAAFDRVVVLADTERERMRTLIAGDPRASAAGVEVRDRIELDADVELTVVAADVLVTPATLRRAATAPSGRPTIVCVDGRPALAHCHGRDLLSPARHGHDRNPTATLGVRDEVAAFTAVRRAAAEQAMPADALCMHIANPRTAAAAEAALCAQLRSASAANDGVLARWIDRRISCRLSRWIVRYTTLRPNHVTLIGTAIGLAGAVFLARGTYATGVLGTLLFLAAAIVDGCDGEVARLTFRESTFGQKLDVTTDNVVHLAIFIGLAVGLHRRAPDAHVGALAALLLGGFALDGALSYYFLVVRTEWRASSDAAPSLRGRLRQRTLNGLEALMNRDFAYLLVPLAIADRLHWFLWGAAIGSFAFAALFVVLYRAGSPAGYAVAG
ncbi:MAG: CDP-alcohol phosphatidyltransferase family protein [Deltaproteobacteria bacterium]|nr:CDP-alcohol phosphatidyltransferase family protein [Deltaproteobacteria bacterium]